MIDDNSLIALIHASMPDAKVRVQDRTGTMDHFNLFIASDAFKGVPLIEQHRMVYGALGDALKDGRIHAVEIKTTLLGDERA